MRERPVRNWSRIVFTSMAVVLGLAGLVVLGGIAVMWVAMADYGSNK